MDARFDAVIVGGGTKGLVTALYLQRYGRMSVAVFERRHEIGGGWASEEAPAPGFIANTHATFILDTYDQVLRRDFPEIAERGLEWVPYEVAYGTAFAEDDRCLLFYNPAFDPDQQRTARQIARFSQADADTWLVLWEVWRDWLEAAFLRWMHNPPPPPGQPDEMERAVGRLILDPRARRVGIDEAFPLRSALELLRDLFEDEAVIATLLRVVHSGSGNDPLDGGTALAQLLMMLWFLSYGCWRGGTHSAAHAAYRVFTEDGGRCFTEREVRRVLIEHGRAVGVELADGTRVGARLVVSGLGPHQLVFELTDPQLWSWRVRQRAEHLSYWRSFAIAWFTWAVHEPPRYLAGDPELNKVGWLTLGSKDVLACTRSHYYKFLGMVCPHLDMVVCNQVHRDPTRVPEGKWSFLAEDYSAAPVRPQDWTDRQWRDFKREHMRRQLEHLQRFAPNMTWDNVIGCAPHFHFDIARMANLHQGCWSGVDHSPSQLGRWRPIPELANHRTPIKGLYATGAAWHFGGGAMMAQGYNCYKVIAEDLGLERPWEGREY